MRAFDDNPLRFRRASSRLLVKVPVTVRGRDAAGTRWEERAFTQKISRNGGCALLSAPVDIGTEIVLVHPENGTVLRSRVVFVMATRKPGVREVAFSFLESVDFWGIRFPPDVPAGMKLLPAAAGAEFPPESEVGTAQAARPLYRAAAAAAAGAGTPATAARRPAACPQPAGVAAGRPSEQARNYVSDVIDQWFEQELGLAKRHINQVLSAQVGVQRHVLTDQLREEIAGIQSASRAELLAKIEALINERVSAGEARLREAVSQTETTMASLEAHMRSALAGIDERMAQAIDRSRANIEQSLLEVETDIRLRFTASVLAELEEKRQSIVAQVSRELQNASKGTFRDVLATLNEALALAIDSVGTEPRTPQ